ncbi:MAG: YihY/virulence factor BrkB family protein [Tunicatimonas sp.]
MNARKIFDYFKETYQEWQSDDAFQKSASIAYYSVFSLPGLLIIVVTAASLIWSPEYVEQMITDQIGGAMGGDASDQIKTMLQNSRQESNSTMALIVGFATLVFGATGVFSQLQKSLNDAWEVELDPDAGIKQTVISRVTALGIVLALAFLLIVSLLLSAVLSALDGWIQQQLPNFPPFIFFIINTLISVGVLTTLFALMFKVLPDADVEWKSVWYGALLTAVLFTIGKFLLGFYFGQSDPGATFGAAGSIILIMLWVYYSSLILLFGAEFTQVFARHNGHRLEPSEHARRNAEYRLKQIEDERGGAYAS